MKDMKYLKCYKIFESGNKLISDDLEHILFEINDETLWKAEYWHDISNQQLLEKWTVFIEREFGDDMSLNTTLPQSVIECIERLVDFMMDLGFDDFIMTFEVMDNYHLTKIIKLDELSDLFFTSDNFIRIEFIK
jgi:hypothetical protein